MYIQEASSVVYLEGAQVFNPPLKLNNNIHVALQHVTSVCSIWESQCTYYSTIVSGHVFLNHKSDSTISEVYLGTCTYILYVFARVVVGS